MWTVRIVVDTPVLDLFARVFQRDELIDVQALIAQSSVERLYVPVFSGFSRMREVELRSPLVRPLLERPGGELRAWSTVIDRGAPVCAMIRSRAATTSRQPNPNRGSINGESRLN